MDPILGCLLGMFRLLASLGKIAQLIALRGGGTFEVDLDPLSGLFGVFGRLGHCKKKVKSLIFGIESVWVDIKSSRKLLKKIGGKRQN